VELDNNYSSSNLPILKKEVCAEHTVTITAHYSIQILYILNVSKYFSIQRKERKMIQPGLILFTKDQPNGHRYVLDFNTSKGFPTTTTW
jgi:hypothetical protein